MRLPRVLASSVVRGAQFGESHGGLYLVDLHTGSAEPKLDWSRADIDFQGRGGDRGLRGIAFYGERILVAVGITPFSESLIRMTRRWAGMLDASWIALHVEGSASLSEEHKERLMKNLALARQLGAEIIHQVGRYLAQLHRRYNR